MQNTGTDVLASNPLQWQSRTGTSGQTKGSYDCDVRCCCWFREQLPGNTCEFFSLRPRTPEGWGFERLIQGERGGGAAPVTVSDGLVFRAGEMDTGASTNGDESK